MKTLFKTTIVILSEYNPEATAIDLSDLVRDAETGESYCLGSTTEEVICEDLHSPAMEFFNCLEEEEN